MQCEITNSGKTNLWSLRINSCIYNKCEKLLQLLVGNMATHEEKEALLNVKFVRVFHISGL